VRVGRTLRSLGRLAVSDHEIARNRAIGREQRSEKHRHAKSFEKRIRDSCGDRLAIVRAHARRDFDRGQLRLLIENLRPSRIPDVNVREAPLQPVVEYGCHNDSENGNRNESRDTRDRVVDS